MFQRLYCIYDLKAEAPVNGIAQCFSTDAAARRMFESVVSAQGSLVNEHPEDFALLYIGDFEFESCVVKPALTEPRVIPVMTGFEVVKAKLRLENLSSETRDLFDSSVTVTA